MKEGRRVIIPTERQVEQMLRKQAEANTIKDSDGLSGMVNTIKDIAGIELYIKELGLSLKAQKEILDRGLVTDEFLNLNVMRILKALRDGDKTNEKDDKDFRFSLNKLIKMWSNSEVELMAAFDKNGKFLGYSTQANAGKVSIATGLGQMVGGTSIHSHPSNEGRFFGGNLSVGDWKGFRDSGEKMMVITSKEGTYVLERRNSPINMTNSQINMNYVKTTVRTTLSIERIKDNKLTKFGCTKSDLAVWRDRHNGTKELADLVGLKYTFIPNKGFEGLAK
jgi:hypothetical protein